MIDIFSYKIFYFTVALLLGFLIGYFLKRDSYDEKVKNQLKRYESQYNDSLNKLKSSKESLTESHTRLNINNDLLATQLDIIEKLNNNMLAIKQKSISLQDGKIELETDLENIKSQIKYYENEIDIIQPEYSKIEKKIDFHNKLLLQKETLTMDLDEYNQKNNSIIKELNKLEEEGNSLKNTKTKIEQDIIDIEKEIKYIKEQENKLKSANFDELNKLTEDTRVKLINYKYKYEELQKKLSKNQKIDKEDIDNFILKNEEQRLVDKILSKFINIRNKS